MRGLSHTFATLPQIGTYRWRDPSRVTPQRLAWLQQRDRAENPNPALSISGASRRGLTAAESRERAYQRRTKFDQMRDLGISVTDAAEAVGVSERTGIKYEQRRRAEAAVT
jgi:transposase